ncbi:MAG: type II secretion system protein [Phycisphaerae bacterium]|nr:type II secretion system protein [Phycisphaerae bacterium]
MIPRRSARRGFTLIEVLVTIAIITVLLSLLVPGLQTVQEASRSAKCMANLRQMSTAALAYSAVWKDCYPAALLYKVTSVGVKTVAWDWEQRADGTVVPGPLWSFTNVPTEVMQCPSFTGSSTFGNDPATGYNYNTSFIGAEGQFPQMDSDGKWLDGWNGARKGLPVAAHRRPSETALFGDGGWRGGANKFMRSPSASVEGDLGMVYGGGQAFRHQGCSHCVFLDGHVRPWTQCCEGTLATQQLLDDALGFPNNGFLSEDDSAYDPR